MRVNRRWNWQTGIAAGVLLASAWGAQARAQTAFTSPDKGVSFTVPAGWRTESKYGKMYLIAGDGTRYQLRQDAVHPLPNDDPETGSAFQQAANKLAVPLVGDPAFVRATRLTVKGGTGGVFRFQSKPANGVAKDTADIWLAVAGEHSLALVPDKANSPDPETSVKSIFETLTLTEPQDIPALARRQGGKAGLKAVGANSTNNSIQEGAGASSAIPANDTVPSAKPAGRATKNATVLREIYKGQLAEGDTGFLLRLNTDGTALATWQAEQNRTSQFTGTYTGDEGNYVMTLNRTAGTAPDDAQTLTMEMRAQGGSEYGAYRTDVSSRKTIAHLELSEVAITGGHGVQGVALTGNGTRRSTSRNTANRANAAARRRYNSQARAIRRANSRAIKNLNKYLRRTRSNVKVIGPSGSIVP